jgi:hypothetical protein
MEWHWRSRAVDVALPMEVARAIWGHAWRVDTHECDRLGTRRATVLLCTEEVGSPTCTPIGWCSMRWHLPHDAEVVIDHIAWDDASGASEGDAWRALERLADQPIQVTARRSIAA